MIDATVPAGERAVLVGHSMGGITIMAAGPRRAVMAPTAGALLASTGDRDLVAGARIVARGSPRLAAAVHRFLLRSAAPVAGGRVTA